MRILFTMSLFLVVGGGELHAEDIAAQARFAEPGRFTAGLSLGTNWSSQQGNETAGLEHDYAQGFSGGLNLSYRLHRHFALEVGAQYATRRVQYESFQVAVPGPPGQPLVNVRLGTDYSFIEIPVVGRVIMPITSRLSGHLVAGPSIGFLASAKSDQFNAAGGSMMSGVDTTDSWVNLELSALGGAGVEYTLNDAAVFMNAYYQHGLTDLNDEPDGPVVSFPSVKTRSWFLSAGVRFLSF